MAAFLSDHNCLSLFPAGIDLAISSVQHGVVSLIHGCIQVSLFPTRDLATWDHRSRIESAASIAKKEPDRIN